MSVITDQTIAQFVDVVSGQNHAMAGATIAASAAQATALGLACVQISQNALQVKGLPYLEQIQRLDTIKDALLRLCDQDATAIADFVALREAGKSLDGQRLLCRIPVDVCRFCVETAVSRLHRSRQNECPFRHRICHPARRLSRCTHSSRHHSGQRRPAYENWIGAGRI